MGPYSPATIWNVPHRRNPNFSGRQDFLDNLRTALTSNKAAALTAVSGMGGVGKTQLALEYAYRYAAEYQAILWVPSEEPTALASAFAGVAAVLGLQEQAEAEQSIAIAAVRRWLDANNDWLLVFDNAPGPDELKEYLPNRATGHVIITSRNPSWRGVANPLPVEKFDRNESIEFLLTRTGAIDRDSANELANELGDLPLALEQAGAYVEQTGSSISHYLSLYSDRYRELWQQDAPPPGYEDTIATTWSVSIQQLPEVAADLLNLCAFLAPENIPRELLRKGSAYLPELLAVAASDDLILDGAVAALRSYSLLEVSADSWSVHRLVQAVVRGRLERDDRDNWVKFTVEMLAEAFPYNSDAVENWPICSRLLPHAMAAAGHAEMAGVGAETTGSIMNQVGVYLMGRGQFPQAKSALERAVEIGIATSGPDDSAVAIRQSNLGNVLNDMGDLKGAAVHLERVLSIAEATLDPGHPTIAIRLVNLASLLRQMGDLEGARVHLQRALAIDEAAYGPDHNEVGTDLSNLGGVLKELGDFKAALDHAERALAIAESGLALDHPTVAIRLNNVATILSESGEMEIARQYVERALVIAETAYGLEHPSVATILGNLGRIFKGLGDLDSARERIQRAMDISSAWLGEGHPSTVSLKRDLDSLSQ